MIKERVLNTGGGGGVDMIHPQFKLSNDICIIFYDRLIQHLQPRFGSCTLKNMFLHVDLLHSLLVLFIYP